MQSEAQVPSLLLLCCSQHIAATSLSNMAAEAPANPYNSVQQEGKRNKVTLSFFKDTSKSYMTLLPSGHWLKLSHGHSWLQGELRSVAFIWGDQVPT